MVPKFEPTDLFVVGEPEIRIDFLKAFIDGSSRQKGGSEVGKTKRGKGTKIMAVADRHGLPVAVHIETATPHEVKLAVPTLVEMVIPEAPELLLRLIV